ncbi:hypothetical protein HPB48_006538 [Haemaphysalis longicornis]|uniref:Transposase n=1 Tax=Haemaphysalis longicornis TaxID=44386 RepID=A0A9J6GJL2_HAELO|nr:hypothetical protein HPB48_006538 [Haemaphysalis longicornis]
MYVGFTLCALRNIVHDLFRRNEPPTAQKIPEEFRRSEHLPSLPTWTIRRLLRDIGFVFEKRERNSMMIQRQDVLIWPQRYLRQIAEYRQQHRKVFYTDETWVNTGRDEGLEGRDSENASGRFPAWFDNWAQTAIRKRSAADSHPHRQRGHLCWRLSARLQWNVVGRLSRGNGRRVFRGLV